MKVRKMPFIHVNKNKNKPFDGIASIFYEINWLSVSGKKVILITISTNWMYYWLDPKRN